MIKKRFEITSGVCLEKASIEAHFLTCYVSLCILRILQHLTNNRYSADALAEELNKMSGTNIDKNIRSFDHWGDIINDVYARLGLDLTRKTMRLQDIRSALSQASHT